MFVSLVRDVFASSLPDMSSTQLLAADLSSLPLNTSVANTTQVHVPSIHLKYKATNSTLNFCTTGYELNI